MVMRRSTLPLWLAVSTLCALFAGMAGAAALYDATNLVGLPTVAAPLEYSFSTTTAQALTVTITDFQTPAAFASLQVAVTLGDTLVGSGTVDSSHTATVALPAAIGNYVVHVIGTPDTTQAFGSFGVTVASTATPTDFIAQFSGNLTIPSPPSTMGTSSFSTNFTSTTAGNYTVTLTDDAFPVALNFLSALIINDATQTTISPGTPTQVTLAAGTTYQLLLAATANPSLGAGLYGVHITDPNGGVVFDRTLPVGGVGSATVVSNPSAQALTLGLADYQYPAALSTVAAAVTQGGLAPLAELTAAGSVANIAAPAGPLDLWTYAAAGSQPGVFGVTLSTSADILYSTTQVVNPSAAAASTSYGFVVNLPAAGSYQLAATDFQFPSALQSLTATVAQNGTVLTQNSTGVFNAAAGVAVVLVNATPPTSGNGLFAVTVQSTATSATVLLDQTQAVGGTFTTQTLNVTASGGYIVTLADLGFPQDFANLAVVLSQGTKVLGQVYGAGTFPTTVTPGTYVLTFVATPGADNYGLYSLNISPAPAPTVTFSASAPSVTTYQSVQLTWSSTNATACSAAGASGWSGTEALSGTASVVVNANLALTLTCTGPGGSTTQTVNVTATPAQTSGHGGGAIDWLELAGLASLLALRRSRDRDTLHM